MSGANREVFNSTPEIRLGRDHVLRVCRDAGYNESLTGLVLWHHGFVIPQRVTWAAAAADARVESEILWKTWQGKASPEELAEYERTVGRFRQECDKKQRVAFCETSFSRIIWEAHEVAGFTTLTSGPTMVYIRGDAGCGKSLVSRSWCQANNHGRSIFYEPKGIGSTRQLLNDLAVLTGIDRKSNFNKLAQRIFDCFKPGMVLVVDEVALLVREKSTKQPLLDLLRRISDITGCAIIFIATDDRFESDLATSSWNDRQWWRRMSRIIDLPTAAQEADVEALFAHKLPDMDLSDTVRAALLEVNAHDKGGFGQVAKIIDDALVFANYHKRQVSIRDVKLCIERKLDSLDSVARRSTRRHRR